MVTTRTLFAVIGGYLICWALSLWTPVIFQVDGDEARRLRALVFFLYYTIAIVWLFAMNSNRRAMITVVVMNVLCWGSWFLLGGMS